MLTVEREGDFFVAWIWGLGTSSRVTARVRLAAGAKTAVKIVRIRLKRYLTRLHAEGFLYLATNFQLVRSIISNRNLLSVDSSMPHEWKIAAARRLAKKERQLARFLDDLHPAILTELFRLTEEALEIEKERGKQNQTLRWAAEEYIDVTETPAILRSFIAWVKRRKRCSQYVKEFVDHLREQLDQLAQKSKWAIPQWQEQMALNKSCAEAMLRDRLATWGYGGEPEIDWLGMEVDLWLEIPFTEDPHAKQKAAALRSVIRQWSEQTKVRKARR